MGRLVAMVGLLTALTAARSARAQDLEEPRARQGYWVGLGYVTAAAHLSEEGKNRGFYTGGGFQLRVGELITPRFGLGTVIEYGSIKKDTDEGGYGGMSVEGSARLWRNLSAHTGFGFGFVYATDQASPDKPLRGGGGAYFLAGLNYDFFPWRNRLTGGWALTPTLDFRASPDGNIHAYSMFLGVQVVWWSGLDRNKLKIAD